MSKMNYILILLFLKIFQIKGGKVEIIDDSSEKKYTKNYLNSYKIPSTMILFNTNGKSDDQHPLDNAFDGNFDSYWKSSEQQGDSVNYIDLIFSKTVSIDRIIYKAPSLEDIVGVGYPIELKIYSKYKNQNGSFSINDTDYQLIDDIISERTGDRVVFILDQVVECDQIRLEWTKIDSSPEDLNAYANEIMLLFPENEYLNKLLFEVFDEKEYYKISIGEKYDLLAIQEIEENIQDYIKLYRNIKALVARAKNVIEKEVKYEKRREFTTNPKENLTKINQFGDLYDYTKNTLKMTREVSNRQPTGIYAYSGDKITIFVECDDGDPLPYIEFTQYVGFYDDWRSMKYPLKRGVNYLIVDRFNISGLRDNIRGGGPIYIHNKYTSEEQSQNIKIYIEGGTLFPLYKINDDEEGFITMLNDYISEYYMNPNDLYDISEFYSDKIIITLNATYAKEVYVYQKESPQDNLVSWEKILKEMFISDGIQLESNEPGYNVKNEYIKIHIRYSTNKEEGIEAYSFDQHLGIFSKEQFQHCLASYKGLSKSIEEEIAKMFKVSSS